VIHSHVADRQLVQVGRQFVSLDEVARHAIDENERRLHGGEVQFGAAEIRMRFNAAIGDRQRASVGKQQQFVRPDAVGGKFAEPEKSVLRVIDADHAGGIVEIVLRGVEQTAVGRDSAMAEEVPAGRAGDGPGLAPAGVVEHDGKGSGLAREHHGSPRDRIAGDVMPAVGQVDPVQQLSRFRQYGRAVAAITAAVGGGEDGVGPLGFGARPARQRCEETGPRGLQEIPAVDERRAHFNLRPARRSRRSGRARPPA
jgi:hypothetical protein